MKLALLQFDPKLRQVQENMQRASTVLSKYANELRAASDKEDVVWLILPEMAFTGYTFENREDIDDFLEPTAAGITTLWAAETARDLGAYVTVGYPERAQSSQSGEANEGEHYYNSMVTVAPSGSVVVNYRKTYLFVADEAWAEEGQGFFSGYVKYEPSRNSDGMEGSSSTISQPNSGRTKDLGKVCMGICMDLNPKNFDYSNDDRDFAQFIWHEKPNIAALSMAWLCLPSEYGNHDKSNDDGNNNNDDNDDDNEASREMATSPHADTVAYWLNRLHPLLMNTTPNEKIYVALANRFGREEDVLFAGSSSVFLFHNRSVQVLACSGRREETCLIVDVDVN